MEKKFIINDIPFVLEVAFMHFEHLLIDVTCVEDPWHKYIASGVRYVDLEGMASDGQKISGKFQIINNANGVFVLKSIEE